MSRDENVPVDVARFLNRASIDELMLAREREIAKGPLLARGPFIRKIEAELNSRKASNRRTLK